MKYKFLIVLFFISNICISQGSAKATARVFARIIEASDTASIKMIEIEKSIKEKDNPKLVIKVGMTYYDLMRLFNPPEKIIKLFNNKKKLIYKDCFVYLNEFEIVEIVRLKN